MEENKLASRKLWVALLTILGVIIGKDLAPEANADIIVAFIGVAYIIGQAIVDAAKAKAGK